MSGHIENAGSKGYFFMYIIIGFILFIALWAHVYYSNFTLDFPYPIK